MNFYNWGAKSCKKRLLSAIIKIMLEPSIQQEAKRWTERLDLILFLQH